VVDAYIKEDIPRVVGIVEIQIFHLDIFRRQLFQLKLLSTQSAFLIPTSRRTYKLPKNLFSSLSVIPQITTVPYSNKNTSGTHSSSCSSSSVSSPPPPFEGCRLLPPGVFENPVFLLSGFGFDGLSRFNKSASGTRGKVGGMKTFSIEHPWMGSVGWGSSREVRGETF
jgi:hypothetical protein